MEAVLSKIIDDTIRLFGVDCYVTAVSIKIKAAHDIHIIDLKEDVYILNTPRIQFTPYDCIFIFNSMLDNISFRGDELHNIGDMYHAKFTGQINFNTYKAVSPTWIDPNMYILEFIRISPSYQRATIEAPERQEPLTRFSNFRIK